MANNLVRILLKIQLEPRVHHVKPRLIEMMHRYQCDAMYCKRFVRYDEELGKWVHQAPRG